MAGAVAVGQTGQQMQVPRRKTIAKWNASPRAYAISSRSGAATGRARDTPHAIRLPKLAKTGKLGKKLRFGMCRLAVSLMVPT